MVGLPGEELINSLYGVLLSRHSDDEVRSPTLQVGGADSGALRDGGAARRGADQLPVRRPPLPPQRRRGPLSHSSGWRVSRTAFAHKPVRPRDCEGASARTKIGTGVLSRWTPGPRPGPGVHALRSTRVEKLRPGGAVELRQSPVSESHAPHALPARGLGVRGRERRERERERGVSAQTVVAAGGGASRIGLRPLSAGIRGARAVCQRAAGDRGGGASEGDSSRGFAPLGSDRGGGVIEGARRPRAPSSSGSRRPRARRHRSASSSCMTTERRAEGEASTADGPTVSPPPRSLPSCAKRDELSTSTSPST